MSKNSLSIGQLSKETGVKVTTIRYYESIGLVETPTRTPSGQRVYGNDDVERLNFIRHSRELGFPMESISELIALQTNPGADCAAVDAIARRHLADVRRRLTQLEALEGELKRMVTACAGGEIGQCAVMTTLADHANCIADDHEKIDLNFKS